MDKRHVYDWDTRVHLLVRGPGVPPGSTWNAPATMVDLAPTFLGLAGVPKPPTMDGKSLMPLLTPHGGVPPATASHLAALGSTDAYKARWRDAVFMEYYYVDPSTKCVGNCDVPDNTKFRTGDRKCVDLPHNEGCWSGSADGGSNSVECATDCYRTEDEGNNFLAMRTGTGAGTGFLYAEFQTGRVEKEKVQFDDIDFVELYDTSKDTWQMNNIAATVAPPPVELQAQLEEFHTRVQREFRCAGDSCS